MRIHAIALSLFMAFISLSANAAKPVPTLTCEGEILRGCVGECGAPFFATHIVSKADVIASSGRRTAALCLRLAPENSSLCGNTGAFFKLSREHKVWSSGDLTDGDTGVITAKPGQAVQVFVDLVPKDKDIQCIRLGEAHFVLGYLRQSK